MRAEPGLLGSRTLGRAVLGKGWSVSVLPGEREREWETEEGGWEGSQEASEVQEENERLHPRSRQRPGSAGARRAGW